MTAGQAPIGTLHFIEEQVYKAQKALIAAKFNGLSLPSQKFDFAKEGKKPAFLAMNPMSKVPFLETDSGCIATSNAIARFIARCRADTSLYGNNFDDEGQIDSWMEFATYELEIPMAVWVYPVLGVMEQPAAAATENAKKDVAKALKALEDHLKNSSFLIGDFVSLADVVVVCALKEGFSRVCDAAFRKPYPKVCAWFETCTKMPQFSSVLGPVKLCQQAEKPQPVKAAFKVDAKKEAPKAEAKKEAGKKEEPKKEAKKPEPKAAAAPAAAAGGLSPEQEAKIKDVGDQIRVKKEKLKAEGLSGKKINDHPDIVALVATLTELKSGAGAAPAAASSKASPKQKAASPKAAPAASTGGGDVAAQVTAVGDEIRVLKEKLKAEGLSGKKINDHPEIKEKVAKLQELKSQL